MRIGLCTGFDRLDEASEWGFDYIEPTVSTVSQIDDKAFLKILNQTEKSPTKPEAFNCLFGAVDLFKTHDTYQHIKKSFKRISQLGASVVVFGSGKQRSYPSDLPYEDAWKHLATISYDIACIASENNLIIALEPLNRNETNLITSVIDGMHMVQQVNHPNFKLLADFYHMRMENQPMNHIIDAKDHIIHLHIANHNGRVYPLSESEDDYRSFFDTLKQFNYSGRLSLEANSMHPEKEAPISLALLRKLSFS